MYRFKLQGNLTYFFVKMQHFDACYLLLIFIKQHNIINLQRMDGKIVIMYVIKLTL